jgi:F-type H+-transporting ATPase subunit b
VLAKARADAEALIERARNEIGGERDRAIQDLRSEVSSLVVAATQRLLGETIDAKAHQRLIDEALTKVGDKPASKAEQN